VPGLKCAQIVLSNDADREVWQRVGFLAGHGASTLGVIANTAAYAEGGPWLNEVLAYLDGNRTLLAEMLDTLLPEVGYTPPEGTYLAWLDFRRTGLDGDLAAFFREQAQVAVIDGAACGAAGDRAVRLNFALPRPLLAEAVERMAAAVRSA
jgi:cystathionine beta-lyase